MANEENSVVPARKYQTTAVQESGQNKKKYRISNITFILMLFVALILDILSLIPAINVVTLLVGGILFTFWWWKLGLGLIDIKKIINLSIAFIVEIIPVISLLPGILAAVVVMFVISRFEDKTGVVVSGALKLNRSSLKGRSTSSQARRLAATDSRKSIKRAKARKARTGSALPNSPDLPVKKLG